MPLPRVCQPRNTCCMRALRTKPQQVTLRRCCTVRGIDSIRPCFRRYMVKHKPHLRHWSVRWQRRTATCRKGPLPDSALFKGKCRKRGLKPGRPCFVHSFRIFRRDRLFQSIATSRLHYGQLRGHTRGKRCENSLTPDCKLVVIRWVQHSYTAFTFSRWRKVRRRLCACADCFVTTAKTPGFEQQIGWRIVKKTRSKWRNETAVFYISSIMIYFTKLWSKSCIAFASSKTGSRTHGPHVAREGILCGPRAFWELLTDV